MVNEALLQYLESFLTEHRRQRFKEVISQRTKHFTVATEDVYQLHNTSAVLRSCDVFGVQNVNIIEERNTKTIDREIAMGAQKWVDVSRFHTVKDCIYSVKKQGYQVIATTPHANDCDLHDFDITKPSCFFFGSETEGVSHEVEQQADAFLKIPMVGFTESLNISVSAAIILQHVTTKLRLSTVNWQLSKEEQLTIRLEWCKRTLKSYDAIMARFHTL